MESEKSHDESDIAQQHENCATTAIARVEEKLSHRVRGDVSENVEAEKSYDESDISLSRRPSHRKGSVTPKPRRPKGGDGKSRMTSSDISQRHEKCANVSASAFSETSRLM